MLKHNMFGGLVSKHPFRSNGYAVNPFKLGGVLSFQGPEAVAFF